MQLEQYRRALRGGVAPLAAVLGIRFVFRCLVRFFRKSFHSLLTRRIALLARDNLATISARTISNTRRSIRRSRPNSSRPSLSARRRRCRATCLPVRSVDTIAPAVCRDDKRRRTQRRARCSPRKLPPSRACDARCAKSSARLWHWRRVRRPRHAALVDVLRQVPHRTFFQGDAEIDPFHPVPLPVSLVAFFDR